MEPTSWMDWYTSVAGVVLATSFGVTILKRALGNVPYANTVPTWAYAVMLAAVLTYLTNVVWHTLPGDLWQNMMQAAGMAAMASGFYEWYKAPSKPLATSAISAGVNVDEKNAPNRIDVQALKADVVKSQIGSVVLIALLASGAVGCAKAPPELSPQGVAAFNALRVGHALDIIRDTAIDAEAQHLISTDDTRKIVDWHSAAVRTIVAVPDGWKATVLAGLDQLKTDLLPATWARIRIYVDLFLAVVQEVM